jgi:hypothetical protein
MMNTTADLLVILVFLAGFYTILGLLCGVAEKARELTARPYQRRRMRKGTRRRTPRRGLALAVGRKRAPRSIRQPMREGAA